MYQSQLDKSSLEIRGWLLDDDDDDDNDEAEEDLKISAKKVV
jgi:hypothetical protein